MSNRGRGRTLRSSASASSSTSTFVSSAQKTKTKKNPKVVSISNSTGSESENDTTVIKSPSNQNISSSSVTTQSVALEFNLNKENKKLLADMLEKSRNGEFPKKEFTVENKIKSYTSYLNFFESVNIVNDSQKKIEFKCLFCSKIKNHGRNIKSFGAY